MRIAVFALACLMSTSIASAQKRDARFGVFDAVLDSLYHNLGDRPPIVVVLDSLTEREGGIAYKGDLSIPHHGRIDPVTIADFERATNRGSSFPSRYRYRTPFHRLNQVEFQQLWTRGNSLQSAIPNAQRTIDPYWLAFIEKYATAWGVTILSDVGFNRDSSQALINARHSCAGNCFSSELILLERSSRRWRIVERINHQSQDGLGSGATRFLGPDGRFLAMVRRTEDSTRRAIADSIRRDKLPRTIRGTVYNGLTGRPFAHAQVFVDLRVWPDTTLRLQRAVADARGRYELKNLPKGGREIEVQCPGTWRRNGGTLYGKSMYVSAGLDTTLDLQPPNLEPCWWPRKLHLIESGELEQREGGSVSHPSPTEAAVYAAIMNALEFRNEAFVVEAETHPWCDWRRECPRLNIAHLTRTGEIDSAALGEFRRIAQSRFALNPATMRAIGARILTSGERAYLSTETARIAEFGGYLSHDSAFWAGLGELYGRANRIVSFSAVGFNAQSNQAITSVRTNSLDDETVETLFLSRHGDRWKVDRRHLESERPSAEVMSGACVPVNPRGAPSRDQVAGISGEYQFELVSSAVDHRIVPWRMRFTPADNGTTFFQVLNPASGAREKNLEPGTYVSSGGARFQNQSGLFQFDGNGFALTIDGIEQDRIFGFWEHYSFGIPVDRKGNPIPEAAGHFCAKRIAQ